MLKLFLGFKVYEGEQSHLEAIDFMVAGSNLSLTQSKSGSKTNVRL